MSEKALAAVVRDWLTRKLEPILNRIEELEKRPAITGQKGDPGERGEKGERGESGPPGERGADGAPGAAGELGPPGPAGPPGERGEKGDSGPAGVRGDPGPQGPRGEPGEKGERGEPGPAGDRGLQGDRGEKGDPGAPGPEGGIGKSAYEVAVELGFVGTASHFISSLRGERGPQGEAVVGPPGAEGKAGPQGPAGEPGARGDAGLPGERGEPGPAGPVGPRGEKGDRGETGRDALQIEILPAFDPSKSYPRGTFARYAGGLIRTFRDSDPVGLEGIGKAGWEVIFEGIGPIVGEAGVDARSFTIKISTTSGKSVVIPFSVPTTIYRGTFRRDAEYTRGDLVTWDGSMWHGELDKITEPPSEKSSAWKLAVRRGASAKDAYQIWLDEGNRGTRKQFLESLRGPPGPEGKPGRDRT